MLTFKNVSYNYENQPLFANLNLTIEQGEFVFLIGKSGAGKTTLLKMIYMDLLPQDGYLQFGNFSTETIIPNQIPSLRRKLGVVFQDFKLLPDRNVYENLSFVLKVTGAPSKVIKRKVISALSDVGLSHKQNNRTDELSGGEQQRIAIARAIINDPLVIIADEPTGNLDPQTSLEILEILQKINKRGTTVIFATHNYDLVKTIDTRIIKLSDGKAVQVVLKKKNKLS